MKTVRVAVTGFGNVGGHVAQLIEQRKELFRATFDVQVLVTGVCGSRSGLVDPGGIPSERLRSRTAREPGLTGSEFMDRVAADVLVEAGPSDYTTGQPGLDYISGALERGLHVIAVSKGALVVEGPQLLQRAKEKGLHLLMSGASASALPTVDFLTYDLAGTHVQHIEAILTGTTTFILDTMVSQDIGFEEALREAQQRGIAEPEPSFDVDGWDTAAKLVIIANAVFGVPLTISSLPRETLRSVTRQQLRAWRSEGLTPRLVGYVDSTGEHLDAGVSLRLYAADHPFSLTTGSAKALYAQTTDLGEFTLMGGASNPRATAAAAIKDLHHILTDWG